MQKFKEMADQAETIAVRMGKANDITKALAGALAHQTFLKAGKKSHIDSTNLSERTKNCVNALFDENSDAFLQNFEAKENILIKLNTKDLPVSSLKYENGGDMLKIILESPKAKSFDPKTVLVEKEAVPMDLLLLIDPAEAEVESILSETAHKNAVKLSTKEKSLAVKSAEILEAFFGEIPDEFKEALWFLAAHEEKMSHHPKKETLALLARLLDQNLAHEKIKKAKEVLRPSDFWKLFGRALARSSFEKETATTWAFLPKADFEKTNESDESLLAILEEMRGLRPESNFFALLWENSLEPATKSISALMAGNDAAKLKTLAELLGASPASSYFFAKGFATFSEAELKIRGFIRRVL
ncbi:MAG: hypothetical protein Q8Q46_01130 [Candidatus Giovannonibacteria bacterium]|nr:hypothetical protein [Candidatus Giovannonibacteria bacterium]